MIKFILGLLLTPTLAMAALSDVDRAEMAERNILKNGGFENGKGSWTASGGSFAIASSGSNLLMGKASATWDSGSASQVLSSSVTIPNGLKGRPGVAFCNFLTPSGAATHTIQAYDGSTVLSSTSIVSSTLPIVSAATFLFPSSGSISLRVVSVAADEPSITIDDCYLGPSENVLGVLAKPQDVYSVFVDNPGTPVVARQNASWVSSITDNGVGDITLNFVAGIFSEVPNCTCTTYSSTDDRHCQISQNTAPSTTALRLITESTSAVNDDQDIVVSCQKSGTDAVQPAFKADQVANSWSGYHDNTCSWSRSNTAYGDPTADASCALVERTNRNFGTVSTSGSVLPAITFTPKKAGRYFVCAQAKSDPGANTENMRLWDGTTTIAEVELGAADGMSNASMCGIYNASSTSAVTLSIQTKANSGTITIVTNIAASAIEWSIFAIDQSLPAPAIAQDVMSSSSGRVKMASARISYSGGTPSVGSAQDGSWVSSVTDNGTGDATLVIPAGVFSEAPRCSCTTESANAVFCRIRATPTTTAVRVVATSDSGAASDETMHVVCIGAP